MVALLREDGEFQPMPVVCDTAKFEQLKADMEKPGRAVPALMKLIRENQKQFTVFTK